MAALEDGRLEEALEENVSGLLVDDVAIFYLVRAEVRGGLSQGAEKDDEREVQVADVLRIVPDFFHEVPRVGLVRTHVKQKTFEPLLARLRRDNRRRRL